MRALFHALLVIAATSLVACATTQVEDTWKAPGASLSDNARLLVIAPSKDPTLRRVAEDELARRIPNARQSYELIADNELDDEETIKRKVAADDFDAVLVFRVVSVDREASWVPTTYGAAHYGYGYGAWSVYDPGYVQIDTYVRVDTNLYDAKSAKLLWASTSRTEDPDSVRSLVDDVSKAVGDEMREQGLIE